jgi:2-oxoglutarate dehydrogenase E1 component
VVNNQVGFTTNTDDARSTRYATDLAKMLGIPIFHVNGEDPEAVAHVARLAIDYRQEFGRDVVVDMYCYRKWGHNEGDEPRYTQPVMYADHRQEALRARGLRVEAGRPRQVTRAGRRARRHAQVGPGGALTETRTRCTSRAPARSRAWVPLPRRATTTSCPMRPRPCPRPRCESSWSASPRARGLRGAPEARGDLLKARRDQRMEGALLDWGCAEALAFATLLREGAPIRLSGQDARRGTFSHRHAVWTDAKTGERYSPFTALGAKGGALRRVRLAALGDRRAGLRLRLLPGLPRRAGDVGGAVRRLRQRRAGHHRPVHRVVEDKWNRLSGIVLLLPHGFEGAGPEHSSARLERFLQLCAGGQPRGGEPHHPRAALSRAATSGAAPRCASRWW